MAPRESSLSFGPGEAFHSEPLPGTIGAVPLPAHVRAEFEQPYVFRPYPAWKYRYLTDDAEKARCRSRGMLIGDSVEGRIVPDAEAAAALGGAWVDHPADAKPRYQALEAAIAEAAAHRNFDDRRMSESAKAELAAQDEAAGFGHVLDPAVPSKGPKGKKVAIAGGVS